MRVRARDGSNRGQRPDRHAEQHGAESSLRRLHGAITRVQGERSDHRHPSAHHRDRYAALSARADRRPSIRLVARAPRERRADDRGAGSRGHPESRALVQASTCYGHDNSYVADAVEAHPERFTGVFSCDILAPDALETMAHWMARGLTGLRLFTTGSTMPGQAGWLDDPRSFPAWRKAEEERPSGLPADDGGRHSAARECARSAFRGLRVVLDHLARPVQDDGPPYKAADSLWELARLSKRVREGHGTQLCRRDRRERRRPRRSSGGSSPISVRRALRGGRTIRRPSGRCRISSRSLRIRSPSCRTATANGSFRAPLRRCIHRSADLAMTRCSSDPVTLHSLLGNHPSTEALKSGQRILAAGHIRLRRRESRQHAVQGDGARSEIRLR